MKKTRRALKELRRKLRRRLRQRREQHRKFVKTGALGHKHEVALDSRRIHHLKHLVTKALRRKHRIEASHREGLDWAFGDISPEAMHAAGKTFVCRYLSHDPSKNLSRDEAIKYSQSGIDCVVVWEDSGAGASAGYPAGHRDALTARAQAYQLGMPKNRPVFFAVDFDAAGPEVENYFKGVADAIGKSGAGIYAGLDAVEYILDRKIVDWGWQTYAWSGHRWDSRAHLKQVLISLAGAELHVGGVAVDYNKSTAVDFGQWKSELA